MSECHLPCNTKIKTSNLTIEDDIEFETDIEFEAFKIKDNRELELSFEIVITDEMRLNATEITIMHFRYWLLPSLTGKKKRTMKKQITREIKKRKKLMQKIKAGN